MHRLRKPLVVATEAFAFTGFSSVPAHADPPTGDDMGCSLVFDLWYKLTGDPEHAYRLFLECIGESESVPPPQ
ncbi:hypothetical protein [Rhizohabitans arisaemae]|uniref:hypothetical protein n=1 Tax=Rhizohabitans arisaemae TaxID=2720610 RepID=UPI0024B199DD|nr:hypothetical protein [Rhizohabitans arisaemae]